MTRTLVAACATGLATALTVLVTGPAAWAQTSAVPVPVPQPNIDSRLQRQESIDADRNRRSGVLAPYPPGEPPAAKATDSGPANQAPSDTPAASEKPTPDEKPTSEQVRRLQTALKTQGLDPGAIDGVMGARTREALRAYQRSQHLEPTGDADPESLHRLGVVEAVQR